MYNSKLLRYYKTLSDIESQQWVDYIQTSFANTNDGVRLLGQLLHSARNNFNAPQFDQEQAFHYCYPKASAYNIGKMRKTMTRTLKSIEEYWTFQKLQEDPIRQRQYLAAAFLEKDLNTEYEKTLRNIIKETETADIHSFDQGMILFESYLNLFDNQTKLSSNNSQSDLTNATSYLQQSYLLKERILKAIWINRNNIMNAEIPETSATNNLKSDTPILNLIDDIINLISSSNKKSKANFEAIINAQEHPSIKDSQHLAVLYRILINYAIVQQRTNKDYGQYIYRWNE